MVAERVSREGEGRPLSRLWPEGLLLASALPRTALQSGALSEELWQEPPSPHLHPPPPRTRAPPTREGELSEARPSAFSGAGASRGCDGLGRVVVRSSGGR